MIICRLFSFDNPSQIIIYMGSLIASKIKQLEHLRISKPNYKLLMVGPKQSGRSTLLYSLSKSTTIDSAPPIRFNSQVIEFQKNSLEIFDFDEAYKMKSLWKYYFISSVGIIFLMDLSNCQRVKNCLLEIEEFLINDKMCKDKWFFFFGTKKDLVQDQNIYGQIKQKLTILLKGHKWRIRYITIYEKQEIFKHFQDISQTLAIDNR